MLLIVCIPWDIEYGDLFANTHLILKILWTLQVMTEECKIIINFNELRYKSKLLQGWLADQKEVELLDWPPCGADLNPIEKCVAGDETRNARKLSWLIPSFYERPVGFSSRRLGRGGGYAATLVESLPRRMQMVIDSEGYWTPYWTDPNKQNFKGYVNVQNS
jgi:hypothetical protein